MFAGITTLLFLGFHLSLASDPQDLTQKTQLRFSNPTLKATDLSVLYNSIDEEEIATKGFKKILFQTTVTSFNGQGVYQTNRRIDEIQYFKVANCSTVMDVIRDIYTILPNFVHRNTMDSVGNAVHSRLSFTELSRCKIGISFALSNTGICTVSDIGCSVCKSSCILLEEES